jgi:beta-carotene 3-hydroxylase
VDALGPRAYPAAMLEAWLVRLLIVAATVAAMEVVAAVVHRHVMHGWGWGWHRSHHEPGVRKVERNDLYGLLFAAISLLFFSVLADAWPALWWVGLGMLVYGLLYAALHDGLVHRRLPAPPTPRRGYLKRLVQAHRLHHSVRSRDGAVSFGFLYAPPAARLRRRLRRSRAAP